MAKKLKRKSIPKQVGGVKLPKAFRQGLRGFLASQNGRALLAEGVAAAAAAMAGSQLKKGSKTRRVLKARPPSKLADAAKDAAGGLTSSTSAVGFALASAARSFVDALHSGKAMADAKAAWPAETPAAPKPRPPKPSRPDEGPATH
jgi:hypothetical protein